MSPCYISLQRRHLTFLSDTAQDATYIYVISVLTGMNSKGGEKATVSITLFGDQGESAKHVLEDNQVRLFKAGAEDWLLLAETSSLGELTSIVLSIEYTSTRHYWYVSERKKYTYMYIIKHCVTYCLRPRISISFARIGNKTCL